MMKRFRIEPSEMIRSLSARLCFPAYRSNHRPTPCRGMLRLNVANVEDTNRRKREVEPLMTSHMCDSQELSNNHALGAQQPHARIE